MRYSVIPVKTGIQSFQYLGRFWISACAGMTTFYELITFDELVRSHSIDGFVKSSKCKARKN
jgi:hypothetical protein